jgi:hypothetical protein
MMKNFIISILMIAILLPQVTLASPSSNFRIEIANPSICFDGLDNDGDGKTDYPVDPGCSTLSDNDETDPLPPPPPAPSGGGGSFNAIPVTSMSISGHAYPGNSVTLLKDSQIVVSTITGPDADFKLTLSDLAPGNYVFSVFGTDSKGNQSALYSFPISLTQGAIAQVSGVFLSPTISLNKSEYVKGDTVAILGQSSPGSKVTIYINSETERSVNINADKTGAYLYNFDSGLLELGAHTAKAKAATGTEISALSKVVSFAVVDKPKLPDNSVRCETSRKGDFNCDKKINLIDFSILAYWYGRKGWPAHLDLNKNGKIDLSDFSIMVYHWTG